MTRLMDVDPTNFSQVEQVGPQQDPPDFVMRRDGRTIGIEISDYFQDARGGVPGGSPAVIEEDRRRRFMVDLSAEVQRIRPDTERGYYFSAIFLDHPLPKLLPRRLEPLAYLLVKNLPTTEGHIADLTYDDLSSLDSAHLPVSELIHTISIFKIPNHIATQWTNPTGLTVPDVDAAHFRSVTHRKDSQLEKVAALYDQLWLVLCVNTQYASSNVTVDSLRSLDPVPTNCLSRLFAFSWDVGMVIELPVRQSARLNHPN